VTTDDGLPGTRLGGLRPDQLPSSVRRLAGSLAHDPENQLRPRAASAYEPEWPAAPATPIGIEDKERTAVALSRPSPIAEAAPPAGDRHSNPVPGAAARAGRRPDERELGGPSPRTALLPRRRQVARVERSDGAVASLRPEAGESVTPATGDAGSSVASAAVLQSMPAPVREQRPTGELSPATGLSVGNSRTPAPSSLASPARELERPAARQFEPIMPRVRPVATVSTERPDPPSADGSEADGPVVRVSIGRIEVRAVMDQPRPAAAARQPRRISPLSLDEYLRQRHKGER
jgi:hypothetical protein